VPELARFYGIIIRMFAEPASPHHRPHFHAYYQEDVAIVAIDDVEIIEGKLPRTQERLVLGWTELHLQELLDDWRRLQAGQPSVKIDPLR